MVAHALDDERGAAVAHREAFAGLASDERFAGGRAETGHVAGDHVPVRVEVHALLGPDDHASTGQALAGVVVDLAVDTQSLAARDERTDRLAAGTVQGHIDCVVGQAFGAVATGDLVADHRAERAVDVADRHLDAHGFAAFQRGFGQADQLVVQRLVELVVLFDGLVQDRAGDRAGLHQHVRQVHAVRLPAADRLVLIQALHVAHGLFKRAEAELGQQLAHLFGDEHEEVDHMLGLAGEPGAQLRVLRGDALRAGVLLAGAHHHAALHDQRRGGEAELLGTQ